MDPLIMLGIFVFAIFAWAIATMCADNDLRIKDLQNQILNDRVSVNHRIKELQDREWKP